MSKMKGWLQRVWLAATQGAPAPKQEPQRAMRISPTLVALSARNISVEPQQEHKPYEPPPGVIPEGKKADALAMDATPYDYVNEVFCHAHFRGYPFLAALTQLPEYRKMSETIAKEMTRKFIKILAVGDEDKSDKIKQIEEALVRFQVRDVFRQAVEMDGFFGRGQIYIDVDMPNSKTPARDDANELESPLLLDKAKIAQGSLRGFRAVEPVWTYPSQYNTVDPMAPDFYKPTRWFVMGKIVHASRLLMFVSREVPDLLKATYNFGGLSLSQLAMPYVDNWLRTRDSVSDTIHSFSTSGIKTNMQDVLQGAGADDLVKRAQLFNNLRDNRGLLLLDKDSEDFFQFNVPLGGLDKLQAQAQEQLCAVSSIPLVKFWGITPTGLNASSEGEIEVFDDEILSQKKLYSDNVKVMLDVIQLSEFGEIDPAISFEWEAMAEMSEIDSATINKTNAETDNILITAGVISRDDARERIIADPKSGYTALEANPDIEDDGEDEDEPDALPAQDSKFEESKHPRAENGQFGSGPGGSTPKLSANEKSAVSSYTGDDFLHQNAALRNGAEPDEQVKRVDAAIEKSEIPAGTKLYRGMDREAAKKLFGGSINAGETISDKAFTSTSKDGGLVKLSYGLGGVILQIEVGEGAKGLDTSGLSRNKHEQETLLPRNAKLKVLGVTPPKKPGEPVIVRVQYGSHKVAEDEALEWEF